MHEIIGTILLVSESSKNSKTEHCVMLIVQAGNFMLTLTIEQEHVNDLLHEFDIQDPMEMAGKKAIIDLNSGFISRARGVPFAMKDSICVTCKISLPTNP